MSGGLTAASEPAIHDNLSLELGDAFLRVVSQLGGGSRDRGLSTALDLRHAAIKSGNQLVQVAQRPCRPRAPHRLWWCPLRHRDRLATGSTVPRQSRGKGQYLRVTWIGTGTGTVGAGGRHILRIMNGGSTPDATTRTQLPTELTSDTAMTLQMSAHAMRAVIFISSDFMIISVATRSGGALSRNAHLPRAEASWCQGRTAAMPVGVSSAGPASTGPASVSPEGAAASDLARRRCCATMNSFFIRSRHSAGEASSSMLSASIVDAF
jgi:hypothetical protein